MKGEDIMEHNFDTSIENLKYKSTKFNSTTYDMVNNMNEYISISTHNTLILNSIIFQENGYYTNCMVNNEIEYRKF